MDPATVCGPSLACPVRGQPGKGHIGLHSRQDKRFLCTPCHHTGTATTGTAFYCCLQCPHHCACLLHHGPLVFTRHVLDLKAARAL
jgi:hypothetical protein